MPYGTSYRKRTYATRPSTGSYRRSSTLARQSTARKATLARARAKTSVTANKRAVLSNARVLAKNSLAIKRLKFNAWGSIQHQVSHNRYDHKFSRDHPICFHVNNCGTSSLGPTLWQPNALNIPTPVLSHHGFAKYEGEGNGAGDLMDKDIYHVPNGPKFKLRYATFEFEFKGYLDATMVRVDFVRQKKLDTDFYHPHHGEANFLPHSLCAFKRLAGFTMNKIDASKFQVLATRRLYFNSKGSANAADTIADRNTTDATTAPIKRCRVSLKLDKVVKQLRNSTDETSGVQSATDPAFQESTHQYHSSWGFDNIHPLANIWCIISTDDATGIDSFLTGDAVSVNIIRRMTWQDHVG